MQYPRPPFRIGGPHILIPIWTCLRTGPSFVKAGVRILRTIWPGRVLYAELKYQIPYTLGAISILTDAPCVPGRKTIDHCFLNCSRAKGVWAVFCPILSALLGLTFLPNVNTVLFYKGLCANDKDSATARYLIKTILYGIWYFCNKATFHNGTETSRAIVHFIRNDIATRLNVDFSRMTQTKFSALWCHDKICTVEKDQLVVTLK